MLEEASGILGGDCGLQYAPLPPKELVTRRRKEMEASIESAEEILERYAASTDSRQAIWDIVGREEILERAREAAGRAQRSILLEVWEEDAPEIREALSTAAERGVDVSVVAYGEPDYTFARVYHHDLVNEVTRGLGARWIVISIDMQEIVTGVVSMEGESRAAWTSHPGLVVPAAELIKHDIYIQEILDKHRDSLEASFGAGLVNLRDRLKRVEEMGALAADS